MIRKNNNVNIDLPLLMNGKLLQTNNNVQYYGNLPFLFPTGRPNDTETVELEEFVSLVNNVKSHNSEFNLLLNGDLDTININLFEDYFSWIFSALLPNIITFSDPKIYHFIANEYGFTNFEISAIAGIKNKHDFFSFIKNNDININHISKIVLHHDVTQNIDEVRSFVDLLYKHSIVPRVLVTESCYYDCPLRRLHYNSFTEAYKNQNNKFINYYQIHCIAKRLLNPESLLDLSGFLIPEKMQNYTAVTGINIFKISGRSESVEWIYNTAQSYLNEKSPDNLFDIIVFTAPLLNELGLKVNDLFYLNSSAYFDLFEELIAIKNTSIRKKYLELKVELIAEKGKY